MATTNVPIEIVLQDPNNPIVPTPDSDGGSTNTNTNANVAVPNTATGEGHTTTDDSSNTGGFFGSSSAGATIIPAVVLTLALGAIVALLIRRHYENEKSDNVKQKQITKKEKLAMAATSTMAVLAATVLVGQLLMTTTNAATADEGTTLSTPDKIQIIANRYNDVTIVASTKAVSYATTDTTFGYKIFMSMAGDNANLYLDGDISSEYYFAPTTKLGLSDNSWGYSFADGEDGYFAMPLKGDAAMAQQNTNPVEDEEFTVYYTMKADKDMPFGVYSGGIAYDIEGYNGFPATLTTMQGMTSEICDATHTPDAFKADGVTIEDNVPTATLTDIRDNKTYTIAKLADGNCWMTQNLDLQKEDLLPGVVLDNTNTDNPANGFNLPESQTSGNGSWSGNETAINTAHVYDLGGNGETYSDYVTQSEYLGNYYNWYSATAGTGTFSMGSGEIASGSICPAGWRLPNNANDYDGYNFSTIDYSNLLYRYNILRSATQVSYISDKVPNIFDTPLSLVRSGNYYFGVNSVGRDGFLWSSMALGSSEASYFGFSDTSVNPWGSSNKYDGRSVRCIAR